MIKNYNNKTVRTMLLAVFSFLSFNCKTSNTRHFTGETIAFRWENMQLAEDQFMTKEDSISIYRNASHNIYRLPLHYRISTGDEVTEPELRFIYYVQKKGEDYAFRFDSISALKSSGKVLADSILIRNAFKNGKFGQMEKLRRVSVDAKKNVVEEVYVPIVKNAKQEDTISFRFTRKLKDLKYSFNPKLDSARDSKLFLIKYIHDPETSGNGSVIPGKVYLFQLKRITMSKDLDKSLMKLTKAHSENRDSLAKETGGRHE